jgi:hypothetical protein
VARPTEAAALAGGEDDGDGGLAHVPSLPARRPVCARRHIPAVDRVTGCLQNDVVRSCLFHSDVVKFETSLPLAS